MGDKPQTVFVKQTRPEDGGTQYLRYEVVDENGQVPNPDYDPKNRKKSAPPKLITIATTTDENGQTVFVTKPGDYHGTQVVESVYPDDIVVDPEFVGVNRGKGVADHEPIGDIEAPVEESDNVQDVLQDE